MAKRTLFVLMTLLAVTGCRQMPETEWAKLQALRKEIRQEGLGPYAPDLYQEFETGFERIRFEYALQANKSRLFRDVDQLSRQIQEEQIRGQLLRDQTRRQKEQLKETLRQRFDSLEPSLKRRSAATLDPRERRMIAEIELEIKQAKSLWNEGDYLRAQDEANGIEERVAALDDHVEELTERYRDPDLKMRWMNMTHRTIRWSREQGRAALIVDKLNRRAFLYQSGVLKQQFAVDLGWNRYPDKVQEGDGATPEGPYRVVKKKGAGETDYYRALLLDYPNQVDRRLFGRARRRGQVGPGARIGALIEIHGEGGKGRDWTQGCVALSNADMQKLYDFAYVGMPVTIVGEISE